MIPRYHVPPVSYSGTGWTGLTPSFNLEQRESHRMNEPPRETRQG
jgi:hypothetical protein